MSLPRQATDCKLTMMSRRPAALQTGCCALSGVAADLDCEPPSLPVDARSSSVRSHRQPTEQQVLDTARNSATDEPLRSAFRAFVRGLPKRSQVVAILESLSNAHRQPPPRRAQQLLRDFYFHQTRQTSSKAENARDIDVKPIPPWPLADFGGQSLPLLLPLLSSSLPLATLPTKWRGLAAARSRDPGGRLGWLPKT